MQRLVTVNKIVRCSIASMLALLSSAAFAGDMVPKIVLTSLIPQDRVVRNIADIPALAPGGSANARTDIPVMVTFPSPSPTNLMQTYWTAFMVDYVTGAIVPNATMTLGPLFQKPLSGGHDHDSATRPNGLLSAYSGNTGPTGLGFSLAFISPEVSGIVYSQVNCSAPGYLPCGPDNFYEFTVKIPDLVALLPSPTYDLIGATATHQSNHWGTQSFTAKLRQVANAYFLQYGSSATPKLAINDISLQDGGLFDVRGDWRPPHREHRNGTVADLRTPPVGRERMLRTMLTAAGINGTVLVHVPPDPPHWHIREF